MKWPKKLDAILLFNLNFKDVNLSYFTNVDKGYTFLYLRKNKNPVLFCSELEYEEVCKTSNTKIIKKFQKDPFDEIKRLLKKDNIKTLGINKEIVPVNTYLTLRKRLSLKLVDVSKLLVNQWIVKKSDDIAKIKTAAEIGDEIFSVLIKNIGKFKNELEVSMFIESEIKQRECNLAFPPIVASGANASMPHYSPKNVKLQDGFCIIDFGVKYNGYCSDMTRTIYLGKPNAKEIGLYNQLLKIQKDAILLSQPKNKVKHLDSFARTQLKGYKKYFIHSLGHGLGREVHEPPYISPSSKEVLKDGMVITIEPGIYIPEKFGIRIEDDIIVKSTPEVITKSNKELIVIK